MNEPSQARVPTEIGPVAGTKTQTVNRPGELLVLRSHPIAVCKSFIFYIYNSFLGVSSKKGCFSFSFHLACATTRSTAAALRPVAHVFVGRFAGDGNPAHRVCLPHLFPSCCAKLSTRTLTCAIYIRIWSNQKCIHSIFLSIHVLYWSAPDSRWSGNMVLASYKLAFAPTVY